MSAENFLEVLVDPRAVMAGIATKHRGRKGVITGGPEVQFGIKKYRVLLELKGRETVANEVWLPAKVLLRKRVASATGGAK